jgi:hypothetical protein
VKGALYINVAKVRLPGFFDLSMGWRLLWPAAPPTIYGRERAEDAVKHAQLRDFTHGRPR